jgi:hypothetical protein
MASLELRFQLSVLIRYLCWSTDRWWIQLLFTWHFSSSVYCWFCGVVYSSVSIVTRLCAGRHRRRGSMSDTGNIRAPSIGCRPHLTSTANSPSVNDTEREADHLTPSVSRLRMSSFILPLPPIHHVHNDNFTFRDLIHFLTVHIDILEDRLLKVSNFTGPHITRSSYRSWLNSVCYCTHYFGLNRTALT